MISNWLVIPALALEAGGLSGLISDLEPIAQLLIYLFAHGLACVLLTMVLLPLLPSRYRGRPWLAGGFLFTLQFAIPFLGSLGGFAGILLALYLPRSSREIPWQEVDIPDLPFQPVNLDQQVIYSEGGLRQVLREAGDPDKRLQALLATRQMSGREGVAILREALKDSTDDVRLLAYSMLEQREKSLVAEAGRLQSALQNSGSPNAQLLKRRLAQIWWEMAYLGLAQGGLRHYYLNSARNLLKSLVTDYSRHNDWRLLARVELALGHVKAADHAFQAALDQGGAADLILPYQAEVAYLQRDYQRVRYCLARCAHGRASATIRPLLEAWL